MAATVTRVTGGYDFGDEPVIELGALMVDDVTYPQAPVRIPLSMLNRHGLIAGAIGTGTTKTLQLTAEQCSSAGIPVFAADIKGDLSGIATPGQTGDRIEKRMREIRQDWSPVGCPSDFFTLGGTASASPSARRSPRSGPTLLSNVLGLNAATGLPIIVAVTSVAVDAGQMSAANASVLVAGGAITVLVLPMTATLLARPEEQPAGAPTRTNVTD